MKTISLRMTEPVRTHDARWSDDEAAVDRILCGIENSLGPLTACDGAIRTGRLKFLSADAIDEPER